MRKPRSYNVKDAMNDIKKEIEEQELRIKKEEFKIRTEKIKSLKFNGILSKSVVRSSNNSDRQYLSLTEEQLNNCNEYLSLFSHFSLFITFYPTIKHKRENDPEYQIKHVQIIKLEKMGVRSYNKTNPAKNVYRVKYFTESHKFLKECNVKIMEKMKTQSKSSQEYKDNAKQLSRNKRDLRNR